MFQFVCVCLPASRITIIVTQRILTLGGTQTMLMHFSDSLQHDTSYSYLEINFQKAVVILLLMFLQTSLIYTTRGHVRLSSTQLDIPIICVQEKKMSGAALHVN